MRSSRAKMVGGAASGQEAIRMDRTVERVGWWLIVAALAYALYVEHTAPVRAKIRRVNFDAPGSNAASA